MIFFVNLPIGLVALVILWRLLPAIRRPEAGSHIDWLGASVFTLAIAPFLVGLTNKQTGDWTDPAVGGLMLVGLVFGAIFLVVESREAATLRGAVRGRGGRDGRGGHQKLTFFRTSK